MTVVVVTYDETFSGTVVRQIAVEFPHERITLRDLIRERVRREVEDYNCTQYQRHLGNTVRSSDTEQKSIGPPHKCSPEHYRQIDWQTQVEKAVQAFERNRFFVLVDDRQVENLDQELEINYRTRMAFVKLTPLLGG